jgi:hypothetical protein
MATFRRLGYCVLCCALAPALATAQTVAVPAAADTYLRSGSPNRNQGGESILRIQSSGHNRSLVSFDQAAISAAVADGSLASARLELFIEHNGDNWGASGRTVEARRLSVAWTEAGATWNCPADANPGNSGPDCAAQWDGGAFDEEPSDTILHVNGQAGWVSFDVTADVRSSLTGAPNHGWLVRKADEGLSGRVDYGARQGPPGQAPRLVLVVESEAFDQVPPGLTVTAPAHTPVINDPTPEIAVAYSDGGSGVDLPSLAVEVDGLDITASCLAEATGAVCQPPALAPGGHVVTARVSDHAGNQAQASRGFELLLGPGLGSAAFDAVADTYLRRGQPNQHQGSESLLRVRHSGTNRSLVRFDEDAIAATVGAGTLRSASLRLTIEHNGRNWGQAGRAVAAHRLTAAWTEDGATWNCGIDADPGDQQPDCDPEWDGGAFEPVASDSVLHTNDLEGEVEFDVTADVAALLSGSAHHGWLLRKADEGASGLVEYASRQGDPGHAPRLVVTFELPQTGDQTPPTVQFTEPAVPVLLDEPSPRVRFEYADAGSGVDVASVRLRLGGQDVTATCTVDAAAADCQLPPLSTATQGASEHRLAAEVRDLAGNPATAERTLLLILGDGDQEAPQVVIEAPTPGTVVGASPVAVEGLVLDDGLVRLVAVNGVEVPFTGPGFAGTALLEEGENAIVVQAIDGSGKSGEALVAVTLDTVPPLLLLDAPPSGLVTHADAVRVSGSAADVTGISRVTVGGVEVPVVDGVFEATAPLAPGLQALVVTVFDAAGNTTSETREVERFTIPRVTITSPADLSSTTASVTAVSGTVEGDVVAVSVNGVAAAIVGGTFTTADVPLLAGPNLVTAVATDAAGRAGTSTVTVLRDVIEPRLAVYYPADGAVVTEDSIPVHGSVSDHGEGALDTPPPAVTVNGVTAVVDGETFLAAAVPLVPGANALTVVALDVAGNAEQATVTVHYDPAPGRRVRAVSGSLQSAPIGSTLGAPLVAQVLDDLGQPLAGQPVLFAARGNDGAFPGGLRQVAVPTDAQGLAAVDFNLGTRAGAGSQVVEASVAGYAGPAVFVLTGQPGPPALLVADSGSLQVGVAGHRLPLTLAAAVTDAGFNRLEGVPVRFQVVAGGGELDGGETEAVVFTDHLGRAVVGFVLGPEEGIGNNVVEAAVMGSGPPLVTSFTASGWIAGDPAETSISGIVLDNRNEPVPGVTLRILGTPITATSGADGRFVIQPAPVGTIELIADGSTVTRPGTWPDLEYILTTVPGRDNTVGMPIFLLPLELGNSLFVDTNRGGTITLPDLPGFALDIEPGSVTFPGGGRSGVINVTVVHSDKIPMVPNFGQQPRIIVTIQPAGAIFDPPARLTLPNLETLAPGSVTEMYSFDHDLGRFVSIGLATVSDDGTVVTSNPGGGVRKAGWHCGGNPSGSGTPHDCPECQECINNRCRPIAGQLLPDDNPGDCNRPICFMGGRALVVNFSDAPPDTPGDCMRQFCSAPPGGPGAPIPGRVETRTDDNDAPPGQGCCDGQLYDLATQGCCGGDVYSLDTQCCTRLTRRVVPKNPMPFTWQIECPNRVSAGLPIPPGNGCGSPTLPVPVPEDPNFPCTGASFTPACNRHDECWSECGDNFGSCNSEFLQRMQDICAAATCPPPTPGPPGEPPFDARVACFQHALAYAAAVSTIGYPVWIAAQRDACNCC